MREHNEFRLERLNRHRFEKSAFDKAILVTGATENHAFHLPMGTDTFAAYAVAEATAARVPGSLLLPPIPFGVSDQLMPYPFTISLTPETLSQVIFEAVDSCVKQGISHFLVVNGHGGNNSAIAYMQRSAGHIRASGWQLPLLGGSQDPTSCLQAPLPETTESGTRARPRHPLLSSLLLTA